MVVCVVTTKLVVLGLLAMVLTSVVPFFLGFSVADLKAAVVLGA